MKRLGLVVLLLLAACLNSTVCAETVYFLVGEFSTPFFGDGSYVLPLSDPCDIAYARLIIDEGPEGPNTTATIVTAYLPRWDPNDGYNWNRNYLEPGLPAWSWYVIFEGFGEQTTEYCHVSMMEVEAGFSSICSPYYTVVAELGTNLEPWNCDLTVDGIVDPNDLAWFTSHWLNSSCGHRYYCEGTDINGSGEVDFYDFAFFANNWLWEGL